MTASSYDRAFFDALYAADPDPWDFRTSPYEPQKYAASFAALGDRRYAAALEGGCSIGELAAQPLETARSRCAALPHVRFECRRLPTKWPDGPFDLIVRSEVLYFLSDA